jgi:hypothetical protein
VLDAAFDLRDALKLANLRRGKARAEQLVHADEANAVVALRLQFLRMSYGAEG